MQDNLIKFPSHSIIGNELRAKLEAGLKPVTDKPAEVIATFEQILCTYLVVNLKKAASKIAAKIVSRLSDEDGKARTHG